MAGRRPALRLVLAVSVTTACVEQHPSWLGASADGSDSAGSDSETDTDTGSDTGTESGPDPDMARGDAGVCEDCPWWDAAWTHRSYLDLDATEVGSDVPGLQVLVALDPERIDYAAAAADGADLRFVDEAGNVLAHELERWAPGAGSFAWVRVDLDGGTTTRVWLYYGNPAAPDVADGAAVWAGFGGVWHLDDLSDASGQGHDGTAGGDLPTEGPIGGARSFDGFGAHVMIGVVPALQYFGDLTIAAWFRVDSVDQDTYSNTLLALSNPGEMQANNTLYGINLDPGGELWTFWEAAGAFDVDTKSTSPADWDDGEWHHVVVTREIATSTVRFYFDGQSLGAPVMWGQSLDPIGGGNSELRFGADPFDPGAWNLHGGLDELRLAPLVEAPERVFLHHRSESDQLITYGAPQGM